MRKGNYKLISSMNTDAKILKKYMTKLNPAVCKWEKYIMDRLGISKEFKVDLTLENHLMPFITLVDLERK